MIFMIFFIFETIDLIFFVNQNDPMYNIKFLIQKKIRILFIYEIQKMIRYKLTVIFHWVVNLGTEKKNLRKKKIKSNRQISYKNKNINKKYEKKKKCLKEKYKIKILHNISCQKNWRINCVYKMDR